MDAARVEGRDETHQIRRVTKGVLRTIVVGLIAWGISAECEHVAHACCGVALEDLLDFGLGVPDAGEVGDGRERAGLLDANDQIMRELARRAARAIGDRHEGGVQALQAAQRLKQRVGGLFRPRREELE